MWEKKRSRFKRKDQDYYSISNKLTSEGKINEIVRDGILKYTASAARTKGEMASFLGIDKSSLKKLLKKYDVSNYFSKEEQL